MMNRAYFMEKTRAPARRNEERVGQSRHVRRREQIFSRPVTCYKDANIPDVRMASLFRSQVGYMVY